MSVQVTSQTVTSAKLENYSIDSATGKPDLAFIVGVDI